jgi:hypothetical protein
MLFRASRFALHRTALLASLALIPMAGNAKNSDAVCQNGAGRFSAKSSTGVAVFVGTRKVEGFGSRDCEALLSWNEQQLIAVPHAWQLDVDAMGIDLGLGSPVLALQMKPNEADRTSTYQIYALKQPPHLLRQISGGDEYSAADIDMDGRVAIWTHDAQAIDGFESIPLSSFEYPPTVVLRFEKRKLMDAHADFMAEFDREIAAVKAKLNPQQLSAFKASDGTLAATPASAVEELHTLMTAKIGVLEIVFAYLYSGREDQAWQTLRDLWPAADYDRIRAVIRAARARSMLSQVDGVDNAGRSRHKREIVIYQAPPEKAKANNGPSPPPMPSVMGTESNVTSGSNNSPGWVADTAPQQIHLYMKTEGENGDAPLDKTMMLDLIIDDAGKVRSVQFNGPPDQRIKDASAEWRFIPALKFGHPVACQMNYEIGSPR